MTKAEWNAGLGRYRTPEQIALDIASREYWQERKNHVFVASGSMTGPNWEDAGQVNFARYFPTMADAQAFAATLPKFLKARGTGFSDCRSPIRGCVWFSVTLKSDGVNGGVNETGLKRLRKAAQVLAFEWNPDTCANSMTEEFFRNLIR